jgi:hypothetical protein
MADTDTTAADPAKPADKEGIPEGFTPAYAGRSSFMEEIALKAQRERDTEIEAAGGEVTNTRGTGPDADPDADPDGDEEARARALAQAAETDRQLRAAAGDTTGAGDADVLSEEDLGKLRVRKVIDGREEIVPVKDVLREAQIHGAADKRLAEATALLKTVQEQITRAGAAAPAGAGTETDPTDTADAGKPAPVTVESVKAVFAKLYEGDTEAAAKAFVETMGAARGPAPDFSDPKVLAAVAAKVQVQIDTNRAVDTFRKDYRDITENKQLAAVADGFLAKRMEEGEAFPDALLGAGNDTRDWLKKLGVPSGAPNGGTGTDSASLAEKRELKSQVTHIRAGGKPGMGGDTPPPSSSEDSRSSVIQEMARSRAGGRGLDG